MEHTFWQKQTPERPLFPDLQWSRPETRATAGKLLIIGGNAHGFAAPATAYRAAEVAGAGSTRILLPHHVQRLIPLPTPAMEFASSTPVGSFSRQSLAELLTAAAWADGVLLAGDFGRNSETAVVLEQFTAKYSGQLTITQDAIDYFNKDSSAILDRPETTLTLSFAQLQKLAAAAKFTTALRFDMDLLRLVDSLHEFSKAHQAAIITKHLDNIFVAAGGQVSSTKLAEDQPIWRVQTAARAAVWRLQNPNKPFEALTSSLVTNQSTQT